MVVARTPQHAHAVARGAALADEVDHGFGSAPAGEGEDLLDLVAAAHDAMVRPDREGQLQRVGIPVDDHDLGGGQRLEDLHADVSESARADDHAPVARAETAGGLGHGVVGGETGVGQRRDVGRFQGVVDTDDAAGGGLEVLGVTAAVSMPGKRLCSQCTSSPERHAGTARR